jgi:hypothetical protein
MEVRKNFYALERRNENSTHEETSVIDFADLCPFFRLAESFTFYQQYYLVFLAEDWKIIIRLKESSMNLLGDIKLYRNASFVLFCGKYL